MIIHFTNQCNTLLPRNLQTEVRSGNDHIQTIGIIIKDSLPVNDPQIKTLKLYVTQSFEERNYIQMIE